MGNTATLSLVFNSFVANSNSAPSGGGAPGGSYCTVKSITVTDNASGQVSTSGTGASTTIKVQQRNTGNNSILITLNISCAGDTTNYNPQSMVFVGTTDSDGSVNFPSNGRNPNDQSITFKDTCTNKGSASWKYYIQIQKQDGSANPPVGWIDPDVQNDN